MPNTTYKSCYYLFILLPAKGCNFHMQVFQIKLKYHCSKPIKLQKFLVQQYNRKYHLKRYIITSSRTSPERSPKMHPKDLVAYGRWSCTRIKSGMGPLPRRDPGTSTSWKIIYWTQFLSQAMCSSMLSLKVLSYIQSSTAYTVSIETTECAKWSLRSA